MSEELERKLCSLAEEYVENEHYRVGSHSYAWEETDYRSDHLDGNVVCGECRPNDAHHYSWWEVVSTEILDSEISECNDETGEYCVAVKALIAVSCGDEDEDVDEKAEPEECIIYIHIERDDEGDFCVVSTEE
ncbi:MAG: hypothetical protein KME23_17750 [Goleter apudmare HA4340-LM2]|nr:hypothetical protein [Goleter apudmare HA4340-LM2]MBW4644806.1 hypothetical protein [Goleter apudmare HA4340-LM2]